MPLDDRFPLAEVMVGTDDLTVWVGDTAANRAQGLMDLSELPPGIDGMLFVFDPPFRASFWMLNTLIPLDIWWFDEQRRLVGMTTMEPCRVQPCPEYLAPGPIGWALEIPAGNHSFAPGVLLSP